MKDFVVKDSGERAKFDSGMVRDVNTNKTLWHLIADGPMLRRFAAHLTKGAIKYSPGNWLKADGEEEYNRFRESAFRHFMQWYYGESDEDHAAAVWFNINGAEYVKERTGVQRETVESIPSEREDSSGFPRCPFCNYGYTDYQDVVERGTTIRYSHRDGEWIVCRGCGPKERRTGESLRAGE